MDNKYKPIPFWSWNDELDEKELTDQIQWMHDNGIGGFFKGMRTIPVIMNIVKRMEELCPDAW